MAVTVLNTGAMNVLFPIDAMDSCEEMMIKGWRGVFYKKDDTAYLCFTCNPEVTYILEYTPSKMSDAVIIKMAESIVPIEEKSEMITATTLKGVMPWYFFFMSFRNAPLDTFS